MIFFWNRKEVYVGHMSDNFNDIKRSLAEIGINYTYKVVDRGTRGTRGVNHEVDMMYYLYVHKKDYERIKYLIG